VIEGKYEFADLDELIVNHVQAMARRVEELMAHEKFKAGAEEELRKKCIHHELALFLTMFHRRPFPT
jgi:hypothetical protein